MKYRTVAQRGASLLLVTAASGGLLSGSSWTVQAFSLSPAVRSLALPTTTKITPSGSSVFPFHHHYFPGGRVSLQRRRRGGESGIASSSSACCLTPLNLIESVAVGAALPGWKTASLACLLPTCLGFYKREYGVSYAYGAATAAMGYLACRSLPAAAATTSASIALWHAGALIFYGVRLNFFLLYRQLFVQRIKDMNERIEQRATEKEQDGSLWSRLVNRTPFILSCAVLYYGLCTPLLVTARLFGGGGGSAAAALAPWASQTLVGLVSVTWFGFVLAAVGDLTKSLVKANKGDKHLVTGGIYRFLRHPNYTGEVIAWTANCVAGVLAASLLGETFSGVKKTVLAAYVLASFFSTAGINFVLGSATNNLERRQKEEYGEQADYQDWIKRSWVGFQVKPKPQEVDEHEDPRLELSPDVVEESGSGI